MAEDFAGRASRGESHIPLDINRKIARDLNKIAFMKDTKVSAILAELAQRCIQDNKKQLTSNVS